jgi:glycosyltransferase involved in cell wall biosynthesis
VAKQSNSVLLVTPWFRASIGGVAKVAEHLYEQFNRAGVEAYIWVCDEVPSEGQPPDPRVYHLQIPGYVFHSTNIRSVVAQAYRSPSVLWQVARFVRLRNVKTVILIHPIEYIWPFVLLHRTLGFRLVLSCHGSEVRLLSQCTRLFQNLFKWAVRSAAVITVSAEVLAHELRIICSQQTLPIQIIPNGVDVNYFTPAPVNIRDPNREPTLIHVSNFSRVKRVHDIITAFAMASIPDMSRLIMVGNGPDYESAISKARSLGVERRVNFVGSQKDVRRFLWHSDVLVMASEFETGPLVLLEAMACGLPWITTPFGLATSMPENECGLVVPPKSPEELAVAMAHLINDPDRCRLMGLRGRQRAVSDLDGTQSASRYLALIQ